MPAWQQDGLGWQVLAARDACLLARLALDGPQPRHLVAAWLWPFVPQARAHANLRQRLFRLRALGAELVAETGTGLQLADTVGCDLWQGGCSQGADFAARSWLAWVATTCLRLVLPVASKQAPRQTG